MVSTAYREQRRVMVVTEARQVEGEDTHQMVIAARERSRNGDELNLRGVSFKSYRKNPVVLWAHDSYRGIPIAKTVKIGHDDQGRIVADFEFNSDDEFAARVENAWNGGFIRAASIRFMPTKVVEMMDEQGRVDRLRIEKSDLLEWSLVPVPADPDAVKAGARALNLPEEIFRGLEPEPEESEAEPPTEEREPEPEPKEADPFIEALTERVDALEREVKALSVQEAAQEQAEAPESDEQEDGELVAVGEELAAIRRIIEEK